MGLSYRQCRRSYKRFREQGDAGLVHRRRGVASNRGRPASFKRRVLKRYRERYEGFGPTLAAEKLAEDGFGLDHETLRRWLLADGQWKRRRKRRQHRQRRERKRHFGELVQMDGSHHRWFGATRPQCCLMNMVDDATGNTLSVMAEEETTVAAMGTLWLWIERHGIPKALYTDKKTVFITDRAPTPEEQLANEEPCTAFGKACNKLGIEIVAAHSPQAKGRVERNHAVYQDRFVKELALRRITTIPTSNALLSNGFSDALNKKFALPSASEVDFHRPLPKDIALEDVFCFEEQRTVQNDWTIRSENQHYQILADNTPLPKPKTKVLVRTRLDGTRHLLYQGKPLHYRAIPPSQRTPPKTPRQPRDDPPPQTPTHSPWRQNCILMAADSGKKTP